MNREITPLDNCNSNISVSKLVRREIFSFIPRQLLDRGHNHRHLATLYQYVQNFYSICQDIIKQRKRQEYDVMYWNLCRFYRDPHVPKNGNEASETPKGVMREHESVELLLYHYHLKFYQASILKSRISEFKNKDNWI